MLGLVLLAFVALSGIVSLLAARWCPRRRGCAHPSRGALTAMVVDEPGVPPT
jgi:hypothetical protein